VRKTRKNEKRCFHQSVRKKKGEDGKRTTTPIELTHKQKLGQEIWQLQGGPWGRKTALGYENWHCFGDRISRKKGLPIKRGIPVLVEITVSAQRE